MVGHTSTRPCPPGRVAGALQGARMAGRASARHSRRLLRFGLVGATGVVVNTALLTVLVEVAGWDHLAAGVVATEGAVIGNFILNDRWTFRDAREALPWPRRMWSYHAVALGGLAISVAAFAALLRLAALHYAVANLGAIGAATLWNYALNARFTWRRHGEGSGRPASPPATPVVGSQAIEFGGGARS